MTTEFGKFYPSVQSDHQRSGLHFEFPPTPSENPIGRVHCAATTVDARGRLAERSALRALGWRPGQLIESRVDRHITVISPSEVGRWSIGPTGYLHLRAALRHACNLSSGDRVLLIAALDREQLLVYPMALLAQALHSHRPDLWGSLDEHR